MQLPILITLYAGFTHAFETDHVLAVSNLVTRRNHYRLAIKDGIYWGLGHTTTILLVGMVMLVIKMQVSEQQFKYFEAAVGAMLVLLGLGRLLRYYRKTKQTNHSAETHRHTHGLAYGVGLIHGMAGSGVLMVIVMAEMKTILNGLSYLAIFGIGSVGGMALAAGLFSLPFSKMVYKLRHLQIILIWLSALLCVAFGIKVVVENVFA
ncbi:MAG: hypothetical protein MUF24_05600 [Chitinophagaceae bacterium]|jgi:cytochrome c biogenesis protein CcdA|nr:hypothetical protein [Chitinophagaceae bacterium]